MHLPFEVVVTSPGTTPDVTHQLPQVLGDIHSVWSKFLKARPFAIGLQNGASASRTTAIQHTPLLAVVQVEAEGPEAFAVDARIFPAICIGADMP